ncbi:hypothetical protein EDD18DRAFT_841682 [Armillaria luteobubalina]|uniref:Thioester reductase (TE) domain-containing protein n=1 Tax=Armillaria luteobubalina TaxID=153913 RepID=A0AA39U8F2_9AGAR|nr:hypothetical protein EDD18DRAFT_841682 [Armillaria luteobubalina]
MGESWAAGGLDWRLKFGQLRLGEKRTKVAAEADTIMYSGALVHGVHPYKRLRAVNIISILTAIELASTGKPTFVVFVFSTSAIDTEHYRLGLVPDMNSTVDMIPVDHVASCTRVPLTSNNYGITNIIRGGGYNSIVPQWLESIFVCKSLSVVGRPSTFTWSVNMSKVHARKMKHCIWFRGTLRMDPDNHRRRLAS